MKKRCQQCGNGFEIDQMDQAFYEKVSPVFNGEGFAISDPSMCPSCRMQHRMMFRNERKLYHRKCDYSGKQIISIYSPGQSGDQAVAYKVYKKDVWQSDVWDARDYGKEYDFSRSFFEQFMELKRCVPRLSLVTAKSSEDVNCEYINFAGHSKNCYMVFDSDFNEDSYYSKVLKHSKFCMDCSFVRDSELCYQCVDCVNCYNVRFSQTSSNCHNSWFLKNCVGCKDCFFSCNLRQKQYMIFNKQYSKDEYFEKIKSFGLSDRENIEKFEKDFEEYWKKYPQKFIHDLHTENCTGDYIFNAQNCHHCYDVGDSRDLLYCDTLYGAEDCMDVSSFGEKIELVYNSGTIGVNCYNIFCCFEIVINSSDLFYCDECHRSRNCFGCVGLRKNEYCILNKQYTKEEYQELVPRIINQMQDEGVFGEFFPKEFSPFAYNETVAQEYFPLTKEEVLKKGWRWMEEDESSKYKGPDFQLPTDISEVDDQICKQILLCEVSGKPYKIIPAELEFYRKMNLPIPKRAPDQRHKDRLELRNPRRLWRRDCDKCGVEFKSTYSPKRSIKVYCDSCYQEEVY